MVFELNEIDMPRYVILQHDWNGVHYDLMMEQGTVLRTWRLDELIKPGKQVAIQLPDHRLQYLNYEGPISGDRGKVSRIAEGSYKATLVTEQCWKVVLQGALQGSLTLQREAADRWQLEW